DRLFDILFILIDELFDIFVVFNDRLFDVLFVFNDGLFDILVMFNDGLFDILFVFNNGLFDVQFVFSAGFFDHSNKTELEVETSELGNYPESLIIAYKETKNNITQWSFNYFIKVEGFYPNVSKLCYILAPKKYLIPNNYFMKTSWKHGENISATIVATNYMKAINKTSRLFGPLLFGLQLQILKNIRKSRTGQYSIKPISQNLIKRVNQCSELILNRHAKNIATIIKDKFIQSYIFKYYNQDFVLLKLFKYTVSNRTYYLSFRADNFVQKKNEILNIIKIMDSNYISHDAYQGLAAIDYHLPCKNIIVFERNNLTQKITKDISIKLVDMDKVINNLEIIEKSDKPNNDSIDFNKVLNSIDISRQHDCKGILKYLISYLVYKNILSIHDPIIYL
ncbi:3524_t:CDS:2, partial [Cetraspora pellucida]